MKNNILKLTKPPTEPPELQAEDTKPIFYGTKDLAEIFGSSPDTVRETMRRKDFPLIMVGKNMKVLREALIQWAMERRE